MSKREVEETLAGSAANDIYALSGLESVMSGRIRARVVEGDALKSFRLCPLRGQDIHGATDYTLDGSNERSF